MNRKQNLIIFSAGESVRNGKVEYLKNKLADSNVVCCDWRELFENAHNSEQIALLPSLCKKIPTFDFALVFAEGVDSVQLRGEALQKSMRDNILFEMGLCVMALGTERVILFAEDSVHIPEDLTGIGKIGVKYITFSSDSFDAAVRRVEQALESTADKLSTELKIGIDSVIDHINVNADIISPVFIGAAVSSAESYFLNFIVRLLENLDNEITDSKSKTVFVQPIEKVKIKIILPTVIDAGVGGRIREYYKQINVSEYTLKSAGSRGVEFKGYLDEGVMTVIDVPTSVTASYSVVNSILNIESDDDYDISAEKRFVTKEVDIYAYTLKKLLTRQTASQRLSFLRDEDKKEKILRALETVELSFAEI